MFLLSAAPVRAAVVINELFPNPSGANDESTEFIEIYNSDGNVVNLSGYTLQDNSKVFTFGEETIAGYGFLAVRKSQTKIGLNNSGDEVTLKDNQQNALDNFSFSETIEDKSWSRVSDGGSWANNTQPTEGQVNSAPEPSPIPSPEPSSTPTIKPSPSPSQQTPKPSLPTPTVAPKVLAAKTEEVEEASTEAMAVETVNLAQESASPSPIVAPEKQNKNRFGWLIMGGGGVLAIGGLFPFLRKCYDGKLWLKILSKGGDRSSFGPD